MPQWKKHNVDDRWFCGPAQVAMLNSGWVIWLGSELRSEQPKNFSEAKRLALRLARKKYRQYLAAMK